MRLSLDLRATHWSVCPRVHLCSALRPEGDFWSRRQKSRGKGASVLAARAKDRPECPRGESTHCWPTVHSALCSLVRFGESTAARRRTFGAKCRQAAADAASESSAPSRLEAETRPAVGAARARRKQSAGAGAGELSGGWPSQLAANGRRALRQLRSLNQRQR